MLTLGLTVHFPSSKLTSGGFPNLVDAIQTKNKKPSNMPFLAGCGPSYRFRLGHACPYPQINELRPSILAPGHRRTPPHASTTRKYQSARLEAAARFRACRARPHATGSRQRLHTHARDSKQAREHIQTEGVGERGVACRHTQCAASVVGFTALSCSFHSAETHGCELCNRSWLLLPIRGDEPSDAGKDGPEGESMRAGCGA